MTWCNRPAIYVGLTAALTWNIVVKKKYQLGNRVCQLCLWSNTIRWKENLGVQTICAINNVSIYLVAERDNYDPQSPSCSFRRRTSQQGYDAGTEDTEFTHAAQCSAEILGHVSHSQCCVQTKRPWLFCNACNMLFYSMHEICHRHDDPATRFNDSITKVSRSFTCTQIPFNTSAISGSLLLTKV